MANVDGLNPELRARVQALIRASGGKVFIKSGYRSVDHQKRLYDAAVRKYGSEKAARRWVAKPGSSNHNHGEAVDLGGDLALAHKLAPAHNLSFPMSWEKWHVQRAEFKSKAGSLTTKPTATASQGSTWKEGGAKIAAAYNPTATTEATPAPTTTTEAPTEDRKDLGTQISSLLNILDKPIDFEEGKVA